MLRRSIAFRLTVLLALAMTVVLLALGQVVITSLAKHFEQEDFHELRGKMELAQRALRRARTGANPDTVAQELESALVGRDALEVTVLGPDRSVLFASRDAVFPRGLLASARELTATPPDELVSWTDGTHTYRGIAARAAIGVEGAAPAIVAVAVRVDQHLRFIEAFREKLWLAVVGAALLTIGIAWLAVRLGIAPVRRVTDVARVITASRLGERLNVSEAPTELLDMVLAFNDMLDRIEDSVRRLSEFSADVAHELRTPISNLMTQTQVALSRSRAAEEYREVLYSNLEESDRLARMVSDMLFLAKADNGLITPHRESVQLAAEVRDLFEFYDALAEEQGVRLTLEGDATVDGDRLMLRRAFSNLLSNAIRHTPRGGQVGVQIEEKDNGTVNVCVANAGQAISPDQLARLFERFYRADPSRHRTREGAGLGLTITKSIVDAHKGTIRATSEDGVNRFEIQLPKASYSAVGNIGDRRGAEE